MASCDAKNEMFRNRSKINGTAINTCIVLTVYRITLFFSFSILGIKLNLILLRVPLHVCSSFLSQRFFVKFSKIYYNHLLINSMCTKSGYILLRQREINWALWLFCCFFSDGIIFHLNKNLLLIFSFCFLYILTLERKNQINLNLICIRIRREMFGLEQLIYVKCGCWFNYLLHSSKYLLNI